MRILQLSAADRGGGAEGVASNLHRAYRSCGHDAWLAVGNKQTPDPHIWEIPHEAYRSMWARGVGIFSEKFKSFVPALIQGGRVTQLAGMALREPERIVDRLRGREDFSFPGTGGLLVGAPIRPDLLQCHNLHGAWLPQRGYFDLRALPALSRAVPTVLTLHDAWLLSGHCAHSFDCERWKTGCGSCPDLSIYPSVRRDSTAFNWTRKQQIFSGSQVYISAPSEWLMRKVESSMLYPGAIELKVIPNGVDLTVFRRENQRLAREGLGIPFNVKVVLCAARGMKSNPWKDFAIMQSAVEAVQSRLNQSKILFVVLGGEGDATSCAQGSVEVRYEPFATDRVTVARYYQAADVYLHAARVDTFPNAVLEAMACGLPTVATAVGGIPEQIHDGVTGWLVLPGDVGGMAERVRHALSDESVRMRVGQEAALVVEQRFDLCRQAAAYLEWYKFILESWRSTSQKVRHCMPLKSLSRRDPDAVLSDAENEVVRESR